MLKEKIKHMKKPLGIILSVIGIAMAVLSLILTILGQMSMSVIGGADGPTTTFIAGKIGSSFVAVGIVAGIMLLVAGILIIVKKN